MPKNMCKCKESFTMIMAGSELSLVQIRTDGSSDALNHHSLLRLQLTLLTGLLWPTFKDRNVKWAWKYKVQSQHLLLWYFSGSQAEWRKEARVNLHLPSASVLCLCCLLVDVIFHLQLNAKQMLRMHNKHSAFGYVYCIKKMRQKYQRKASKWLQLA